MSTTMDDMAAVPMRRARTFGLPPSETGPRGPGRGPLRELLALVSRRSESYAWRWNDGAWNHGVTDKAMFHGDIAALERFGITSGFVVEKTDSPRRFVVSARDREPRTLELAWDSMDDDVMSMPPHLSKLPGSLRAGIIVGSAGLSWVAMLAALGVFG